MDTTSRRRFMNIGLLAAAGAAADRSAAAEERAPTRPFYLAIYGPGPNWLPDKPTREQPLREHGRYMLRLFKEGRLRLAGAFGDEPGGAAAFEAEDDAAAQAVVAADPAVIDGVMVCDLRRWRTVDWAKR